MQVREFGLSFKHGKQHLIGSCQKYKVPTISKHGMIRVAVSREGQNSDVYIFYEVNEPGKRFFWYELPDLKQGIAKSIAKAL